MRLILSLTFILSCSGFISLGQTEINRTKIIGIPERITGCCPRVIIPQSKELEVEKEIEKEQNSDLLDITDPEIDGLMVRPNPTNGRLSVEVPASWIGFEIQVYDMAGRRVGNPVPITTTTENMTLEGESGIYLIVIRTDTKVFTERILLDTY